MRLNFDDLNQIMEKTLGTPGTPGTASNHAGWRVPSTKNPPGTPGTKPGKQGGTLCASGESVPTVPKTKNAPGTREPAWNKAVPTVPTVPKQKHDSEKKAPHTGAVHPSPYPAPAPASAQNSGQWPHGPAMNETEIDTLMTRLALFTGKGATVQDAEKQADRLMVRDREGDDRRLCLECAHLHGVGPWHCGNWRQSGMAQGGTPRDTVALLQRCRGYRAAPT